jgi:hypothetical protein
MPLMKWRVCDWNRWPILHCNRCGVWIVSGGRFDRSTHLTTFQANTDQNSSKIVPDSPSTASFVVDVYYALNEVGITIYVILSQTGPP